MCVDTLQLFIPIWNFWLFWQMQQYSFPCYEKTQGSYCWLVRVTLVVGLVFLPQNFGPMVGSYEWLLQFCECTWGAVSIFRWLRHLTTICCNWTFLWPQVVGTQKPSIEWPLLLCPLISTLAFSLFAPSHPHPALPLHRAFPPYPLAPLSNLLPYPLTSCFPCPLTTLNEPLVELLLPDIFFFCFSF